MLNQSYEYHIDSLSVQLSISDDIEVSDKSGSDKSTTSSRWTHGS